MTDGDTLVDELSPDDEPDEPEQSALDRVRDALAHCEPVLAMPSRHTALDLTLALAVAVTGLGVAERELAERAGP